LHNRLLRIRWVNGKVWGNSKMARIRMLHLHSTFDLGGKEARTAKLMNHFGDAAEHVILVGDNDALSARDAIDPDIKVEFPGDAAPSLLGLPAPGRYRKLAQYMQRFDLVLSYNWGAMDGVMAHTLLGSVMKLPPLIHHEDGFNEDEADKLNWKRNWFRIAGLLRSYALVVPSQKLEAIARQSWRLPEKKIHRFPNGIDIAAYLKSPHRDAFPGFRRDDDEIVVGTVAGLRTVKNLPRLLRAVAAAGPNVRLAIAGTGPERDTILAEAARLGISDRLIMPGFLRDPARYVGLFDIFALSSDSEQYPISLVEGMAAGCAVAATDVGDIRNIVAHENREFIVPRDDEDALAAAIRRLANDAGLRSKLAKANTDRAVAEYDEGLMFARYRQLYSGAMNRTDFTRQN
jgi:L-malate glycosyltransferase